MTMLTKLQFIAGKGVEVRVYITTTFKTLTEYTVEKKKGKNNDGMCSDEPRVMVRARFSWICAKKYNVESFNILTGDHQ